MGECRITGVAMRIGRLTDELYSTLLLIDVNWKAKSVNILILASLSRLRSKGLMEYHLRSKGFLLSALIIVDVTTHYTVPNSRFSHFMFRTTF